MGTLTQTDYIKPVAGTFVSGYGTGEDIVNYGVDWTCSEGITVVAARAGKVTRAGWYGGYGYCVDIQTYCQCWRAGKSRSADSVKWKHRRCDKSTSAF